MKDPVCVFNGCVVRCFQSDDEPDNDQVGRRDYFELIVNMSRLLLTLALCLLGLIAASSVAVKAPGVIAGPVSVSSVTCGFCGPVPGWNWGWRRPWPNPWGCGGCSWYIKTYCCRPGILFNLPLNNPGMYMCFNGKYRGGCGGFMGSGSILPACQYNGMKMCGPSYRLSGSKCIKELCARTPRIDNDDIVDDGYQSESWDNECNEYAAFLDHRKLWSAVMQEMEKSCGGSKNALTVPWLNALTRAADVGSGVLKEISHCGEP
ncbi:hypothetical protein LSAT2_031132 [Lamellibrachia satsuma]|nr:hypothetical protein LSAT2_031132 [Lamellibrachia satsuma]